MNKKQRTALFAVCVCAASLAPVAAASSEGGRADWSNPEVLQVNTVKPSTELGNYPEWFVS